MTANLIKDAKARVKNAKLARKRRREARRKKQIIVMPEMDWPPMPHMRTVEGDSEEPVTIEDMLAERRLDMLLKDPKYSQFDTDCGVDDLIESHFVEQDKLALEIRDKFLVRANLDVVESNVGIIDPSKVDFEKEVKVRLLLKNKAVRDGDLDLYESVAGLTDEECADVLTSLQEMELGIRSSAGSASVGDQVTIL